MTNLIDDPKLTVYALGEYEALGPGERESLERAVAADPELSAYVESLRQAAGTLEASLAAEPAPGLASEQKAAIEQAVVFTTEITERTEKVKVHRRTKPALSLAACVMLAATVGIAAVGLSLKEQGRDAMPYREAQDFTHRREYDEININDVFSKVEYGLHSEGKKGTRSVAEHPKSGFVFPGTNEKPLFPIGGGPGADPAQPAAPRLGSIEALERSVLGDLCLPEQIGRAHV